MSNLTASISHLFARCAGDLKNQLFCFKVLDLSDVPKALLLKAGRRCSDRQKYGGRGVNAMATINTLLKLFPEDVSLWNDLGVKGLTSGKKKQARKAFQQVL